MFYVAEKIRWGTLLNFRKCLVSKDVRDKREGRLSRFSVEIVLSHSAENFHRGSLLSFRRFLVSKNVRDEREGRYHDFQSKLFCFRVPKSFVEEPFSVQKVSGIEKCLGWEKGRVSRFSVKIILSHSAENFRRGTFLSFRKFLVSKNVRDKREGRVSRFSVKIVLSHSAEKFRRGTLLSFRKFLVSKNVRDERRGGYHDFPSK